MYMVYMAQGYPEHTGLSTALELKIIGCIGGVSRAPSTTTNCPQPFPEKTLARVIVRTRLSALLKVVHHERLAVLHCIALN